MLCWILIATGRFSPVAENASYSLLSVPELLIELASVVAEHRLWGTWTLVVTVCGLSSCGARP